MILLLQVDDREPCAAEIEINKYASSIKIVSDKDGLISITQFGIGRLLHSAIFRQVGDDALTPTEMRKKYPERYTNG